MTYHTSPAPARAFVPNDAATVPAVAGLSPTQERILSALAARPMGTAELVNAIYGDREDGGPDSAVGAVKVQICLMRRKLVPEGWDITRAARERPYRLVRL